MTVAVSEKQGAYLAQFDQVEKALPGSRLEWLRRVRQEAIQRFGELGFPTSRNEEWKFTSVAPIAGTTFHPARYELSDRTAEKIRRSVFFDLGCSRLVFVNGFYCRELSQLDSLPSAVRVQNFAAALSNGAGALEEHLARHASFEARAFTALNTAFFTDGAVIQIGKGVVLEKPIYLLFVSVAGDEPFASHPRNLIVVDRESQVGVIEGYLALDEGVYLSNPVTEIVAGEGAVVDYTKLQQESERGFHVATLEFHQDRSSSVSTHSIALGGRLAREDLNVVLDGEGAESLLDGLYVTTGDQHVDHHTTLDHAKPHCGSREIYKGVLDGKSSGVFNGKIIVRKDAQKTDAKQSNKNLLLSEGAMINTKPQLEILADDVKCTHGATVGQIDEDAIFYLRTRGIGAEEARSLLTYAFTSEILGRMKFAPFRKRLKDALFARLAKGPGQAAPPGGIADGG